MAAGATSRAITAPTTTFRSDREGRRLPKQRVDVLLVEQGLAESRERAQALVMAGVVYSGEQRIEKSGQGLPEDAPLEVRGDPNPYVSRGGLKLAGALDTFGFDPRGKIAADIGASTGGFTDVLLQRGATRVYAIDVGKGQLHARIAADPRVVVMDETNARFLDESSLAERVELVVVDASFIGFDKLVRPVRALLVRGGAALVLVKPQFEVGKDNVGRGGVVRDESVRRGAIDAAIATAEAAGFRVRSVSDSLLKGPKGNQETFLWLELVEGSP